MMHFEVDEIVTVMTDAGECVGKFKGVEYGVITLTDPRWIIQTENGGLAFAHGPAVSGFIGDELKEASLKNWHFALRTNKEFSEQYNKSFSKIITPSTEIISGN